MNKEMAFDSGIVQSLIERHKARRSELLPVLHKIQSAFGYIPLGAVAMVAHKLNLSRAEVQGAIHYYPHFWLQPTGKHVVRLCRAEACQSVGAEMLADHAMTQLGCDFNETTNDGSFTLEPVYCLGQCTCGPSMMIDDEVHARVTPDKFNELLYTKRAA